MLPKEQNCRVKKLKVLEKKFGQKSDFIQTFECDHKLVCRGVFLFCHMDFVIEASQQGFPLQYMQKNNA